MGNLLYLVHRLPYPPNKGDKVRSYHLLKHLVKQHRVFLGTFVDDPADEAYVDTVRQICPDVHIARLHPRSAKLRSLSGLLTHQALGLRYYQNTGLQDWVNQTLAQHKIDASVIFSSVMAQYLDAVPVANRPPMLVDFVDVDSAKWTQYAAKHPWPMSWLYRREGERLLAYERTVALQAQRSFFVTDNETALFQGMAPECAHRVETMSNGVDADFFSPDPARQTPFTEPPSAQPCSPVVPIVFTGAMDYWPNIDAVTWFVSDILPPLLKAWPQLRFYIVGRSPPAAVLALASSHVIVTGTVPDVRPYLQHAAVVVAPLRVARGIQNKILEAMAMARPVVAAQSCVDAIDAHAGTELVSALATPDFVREISTLLASPAQATALGQAGRQRVVQSYSWQAHLSRIDAHLVNSPEAWIPGQARYDNSAGLTRNPYPDNNGPSPNAPPAVIAGLTRNPYPDNSGPSPNGPPAVIAGLTRNPYPDNNGPSPNVPPAVIAGLTRNPYPDSSGPSPNAPPAVIAGLTRNPSSTDVPHVVSTKVPD